MRVCWLSVGFLAVFHVQAQSARFMPAAQLPATATQGQWPDLSADLCAVASETLAYLNKGQTYDPAAIHGGTVTGVKTELQRVKTTLQYICQIQRADAAKGQPSRLTDPAFIQRHFELVRWLPDQHGAARLSKNKPLLQNLPNDRILKTKYFVKIADARPNKSPSHPQALYGLPFDEQGLSVEQALAKREQLLRFQLGKQQIVQGALDSKPAKAPALVWLSREDLEGALLQGTAVVPNGSSYRYFNVHRGNEIPYDRTIKPEQQQRYWYFKEVSSVLGYGKDADYKIPIKPQVTVAGDIAQLGLGKLFLLNTNEHGKPVWRLTVLADTGGAFANNLYQLDWLSGYYRGWPDYYADNKHRGDYSEAYLLLKKEQ